MSRSIMDFYESPNGHTSSNHSNSSHKSHTSNNSATTAKTVVYNLKYFTSSSSVSPSPPAISTAIASTSATAATIGAAGTTLSCSPLVVEVAVDKESQALSTSSVGSNNSRFSPTTAAALNPSFNCPAQSTSQGAGVKRKRQPSTSVDTKDPDVGCEPPSAKRKQRLPSPYKSDTGSVVSSVYPSPDDVFGHEFDTHSSDCIADDIPDSPSSFCHADVDEDEDDDGIVSSTTSPSICSIASPKSAHHEYATQSGLVEQPLSAPAPLWQTHHGERTPGTRRADYGAADCSDGHQKVKSFDVYASSQTPYDCMTPGPEPPRLCPLPALAWANADDVWQLMCKKDEQATCLRTPEMLDLHPSLQPRMRGILLDWLIEVCEVYKLHRETYYLAVDYLDRYLSAQKNVQKTHLQLIGITCLFVAAKVEEIYPPKIGEFAYVTDGACHESDILKQEVLLLQALEWSISPVTPMGWLGVFMQLNINNRTPSSLKNGNRDPNDAFIYPQFSGMEFVQTAQLLDLCSLDAGIANYSYATMAAAAMSHTFDRETAVRCSGLDWQTIQLCARWMEPFFQVVREESKHLHLTEQNEQIQTKYGLGHICPNIVTDDSHIIQTHTTTMVMFDRVCLLQEQSRALTTKIKQEASPAIGLVCPEGLLTPPASSRKPFGTAEEEEEEEEEGKEEAEVDDCDVEGDEEDAVERHERDEDDDTDSAADDDANITVKAVAGARVETLS